MILQWIYVNGYQNLQNLSTLLRKLHANISNSFDAIQYSKCLFSFEMPCIRILAFCITIYIRWKDDISNNFGNQLSVKQQ